MAKRRACPCQADLDRVRCLFAVIALAEIKSDPSWERLTVQLSQLMIGDPLEPL